MDLFDKYWGIEVHGTPMFRLHQRLKMVKTAVKEWAVKFGNLKIESHEVANQLNQTVAYWLLNPSDVDLQSKCDELKISLTEL